MKKIIIISLVIISLLTGCSGKQPDVKDNERKYFTNMPSFLEDDECIVAATRHNGVIAKGLSIVSLYTFWIISAEEIEDKDIDVKIEGIKTGYTLLRGQSELYDEEFFCKTMMAYNGIDEDEIDALQFSLDIEDRKKYEEIYKEYYSISKDEYPQFYVRELNIQFNMPKYSDMEDETVNKMTLIIKGKEYNEDIGNLVLRYNCIYGYSGR